jgi:hypothetical protein
MRMILKSEFELRETFMEITKICAIKESVEKKEA